MMADQPARPANILNIVAMNQGRRPLTMSPPVAPALSPSQVQARLAAGALLLDARESPHFGAAHIPNALNIQLSSSEFEQRVGWVAPPDQPTILLAETDEDIPRALLNLAFVGLDGRVEGYLQGGMGAWIAAGLPHATVPQISVQALRDALDGPGMKVLDVREASEWDDGHIEGAQHMTFKALRERFGELGLGPEDRIAVTCATGKRSSTAASLLRLAGFLHVHNVSGGMEAWKAAGYPMINVA